MINSEVIVTDEATALAIGELKPETETGVNSDAASSEKGAVTTAGIVGGVVGLLVGLLLSSICMCACYYSGRLAKLGFTYDRRVKAADQPTPGNAYADPERHGAALAPEGKPRISMVSTC